MGIYLTVCRDFNDQLGQTSSSFAFRFLIAFQIEHIDNAMNVTSCDDMILSVI